MRVLICGSRDWPDGKGRDDPGWEGRWHQNVIRSLLKGLYEGHHVGTGVVSLEPFTLIEGCADGADWVAHLWEKDPLHEEPGKIHQDWGIPMYLHEHYPADWTRHGRAAGLIRNRQMLEQGKPDVVYAFAYRRLTDGTRHMTTIAREAGIPVFIMYG